MARLFNKSNPDYIDYGDVAKVTGDEITVSCWLKLDGVNGEQKLVAKWADVPPANRQYLMAISANEKMRFAVNTPSTIIVEGSTTIPTGTQRHLATCYDGSNIILYLDGIQDGFISASGNIIDTTAHLVLGAGSSGSGSEAPFDGHLGHAAVWDRALPHSAIASLANGASPLQFPDGLVFYSPLNGRSPEPDIVGGATGVLDGTTVVPGPPIPNSIKAP